MRPPSHQETVGTLLKGIGNPNADAADRYSKLRRLFWSELSYRRVDQPLSSRQWPESTKGVLAGDPVLFATDDQDHDFHVIYSRLASDRLLYQPEQEVVSQLLKDHPYSLFIFSNQDQSRWHFLNVKESNLGQTRRRYRRITVGPEEQLRTATERISMLDVSEDSEWVQSLQRQPGALDFQNRLDEAFDVEAVTRKFFEQYRLVFESVEDLIEGFKDKDQLRIFTQRLFNRLMFIKFIQKKGWLEINTRRDYLFALWDDFGRGRTKQKNFYRDRLKPLFFLGLNTPEADKDEGLKAVIGSVPYLNGGLFEEDADDRRAGVIVPDACFSLIFEELFDRFNFTVAESTPLNVEVAVDPEMLGKVFEELVTGRHESGSYYTPKPVVSFMCRESLKSYLGSLLNGESAVAIGQFVDEHDPSKLRKPEAVLEALRKVKVCDPACGSGAYLLGMLHELLDLRQSLFAATDLDPLTTYERKLEIIQNNLYGVDLDPFAVNIARLRLWLSLAVDFEGRKPQPLPNLDFKIEVGDSLAGPDPSGGLQPDMFRKVQVDEYFRLKSEYLKAHGTEKAVLRDHVNDLRREIASWAHPKAKFTGFDWAVEFAEVFSPELASEVTWTGSFGFMNEVSGQQTFVEGSGGRNGGFDIVLANPPYVRMELFKDAKPTLKKNFPKVHSERADLYCYFYDRALQLLTNKGVLTFISPNKWFRAKYGANLRAQIAQSCRVISITDFGDLPVFQDATTYPMIFIAQKGVAKDGEFMFTEVKSLEPPYPDLRSLISESGQSISAKAINGSDWVLTDYGTSVQLQGMFAAGVPLGEYVSGKICYGIKTGLNDAFYIDGATRAELIRSNPKAKGVIKPLVVGKDIRKWRIDYKDAWMIYTNKGIDVSDLGAVLRHIRPYKDQLEERPTQQEWYELQQPQARYAPYYEMPKIMYPIIAKEPRFAFDTTGSYPNDKCFAIPVADLYLLGVLNSSVIWNVITKTCSILRGGFYELRAQHISKLPIPNAPPAERKRIEALVKMCLKAGGVGCEEWEKEIDDRVSALYR